MLAAFGLGSVAGTFLYGPTSKWLFTSRRWTLLGCFAVAGLLRLSIATEPGPIVTTTICLALGLTAGPLNPALSTVMFERVPENMRGRVFALTGAVAMSAAPVGILVSGWAIDGLGLRTTLLCFGSAYLVLVLASLGRRALRDMDNPVTTEQPGLEPARG